MVNGGQLHAYITGILKNHNSPLIEINSVADPSTCCSGNPRTTRLVEQVKSSSSGWIKTLDPWYFAWQTGYGEFSVSPTQAEVVRKYIQDQPEHHPEGGFSD